MLKHLEYCIFCHAPLDSRVDQADTSASFRQKVCAGCWKDTLDESKLPQRNPSSPSSFDTSH